MVLFAIILTALVSSLIVYKILEPKLKVTCQLNTEIQKQNEELIEQNKLLHCSINELELSQKELLLNKSLIEEQINSLHDNFKSLEKQTDLFYKDKLKIAQDNFAQSLELEAKLFQENVNSFQEQYNETVALAMQEYSALEKNITSLKEINDAAVAAAKRAEEMKAQVNFYRLQLSAQDIEEIRILRNIASQLRDKEPLNKVIWKCYYEKPTTDMIGRVIGSGTHTGIYKITNIENNMCYVGQSANLSDRFKQHIKRGIGAEAPTRNKLYPVMLAIGPENFTFEIIEECDRSLLDEREKYWTDYFKAQEFGYSIRKG